MNTATLTLDPGRDRVPPAPAPRSTPPAASLSATAAASRALVYGEGAAGQRRTTGLAVVVGIHLLIGWLLASGLARQAIEVVKKPIEMVIVPEEVKPPPPPPPPKVEKIKDAPKVQAPPPPSYVPPPDIVPVNPPPAPVIEARQPEPPPAPVEIAPPPPAPPKPAVVKQEIALACPGYQNVLQTSLGDAFDRVGVPGVVKTLLKVRGNQVVEAVPQSGPKGYYKYLQDAARRIKCSAQGADEVQVLLEVAFQQG